MGWGHRQYAEITIYSLLNPSEGWVMISKGFPNSVGRLVNESSGGLCAGRLPKIIITKKTDVCLYVQVKSCNAPALVTELSQFLYFLVSL